MKNAIISCLSSYSYTNNGCSDVLTETPSPISSNLVFSDDNSLCIYGDFPSSHAHFDPQNNLNNQSSSSILSGSTLNFQGETLLNYMPVQDDIFYQPWESNYVQQSTNEIQLIQNSRKKDISKRKNARKRSAEAGSCSSINTATIERDEEKKRPASFQGKLPNIKKEKEPIFRRRSQQLTDKITALQKLVSPYGKTDTASVLLEASGSIKALHDQIEDMFHMLSREQTVNMTGEQRSDLQSRGMCLVPSVLLEKIDERLAIYCHQITSETQPAVSLFAEELQLNPFKD